MHRVQACGKRMPELGWTARTQCPMAPCWPSVDVQIYTCTFLIISCARDSRLNLVWGLSTTSLIGEDLKREGRTMTKDRCAQITDLELPMIVTHGHAQPSP